MTTPSTSLWYLATPPPTVPVPAASVPELKDKRIIVGTGNGFRYDMVAGSDAHVRPDGRTYVSVLSEYDQYRAALADVDVVMHPTPIAQVWVEHRLDPAQQPAADGGQMVYDWGVLEDEEAPAEGRSAPGAQRELFHRLVNLDAPPGRAPRRATEADFLTGRRVILVNPGEFIYGSRAISEPYRSAGGDICVNVASARNWYAWAITGAEPEVIDWRIERVWVE